MEAGERAADRIHEALLSGDSGGFGDVEIALIAIADGAERERLAARRRDRSRGRPSTSPKRGCARGTIDLVTLLQTQQTLFIRRGSPRAGAPCPVAGGIESLSGTRRQLAPAGSGGRCKPNAMTAKRRTIVTLLSCLGRCGAVAAVYLSPWKAAVVQQFPKRKGGGGGPADAGRFRCWRSAHGSPTYRSISTASAPRARSTP